MLVVFLGSGSIGLYIYMQFIFSKDIIYDIRVVEFGIQSSLLYIESRNVLTQILLCLLRSIWIYMKSVGKIFISNYRYISSQSGPVEHTAQATRNMHWKWYLPGMYGSWLGTVGHSMQLDMDVSKKKRRG